MGEAAAFATSLIPFLAPEAGYLLRFAEEAFAALVEREPDPIETAEHAAVAAGKEGFDEA